MAAQVPELLEASASTRGEIVIEPNTLHAGDCLDLLRKMPDNSVDLVMCSPPYEDARTYGIGFKLRGQDWVDWAFARYMQCVRVSRGLVAWVVEGKTKQFRYTATPVLLMADLHRAGVHLRKPPLYVRDGIPGSGGPDWLKNKYEFVLCATSGGELPWSENTAMGHPPKFGPGGAPSHRRADGTRANGSKTRTRRPGGAITKQICRPPTLANPGNLILCGPGGGGHMGHDLAHENEAPFPEYLAEDYIRSLCPPGGIVLDPFIGSGTTAAAAIKHGRQYIGFDVRESQIELTRRRLGIQT
jgi:hypothetical protein